MARYAAADGIVSTVEVAGTRMMSQSAKSEAQVVINIRKLRRWIGFGLLLIGVILWLIGGIQTVLRLVLFEPFWSVTILLVVGFIIKRKKIFLKIAVITFALSFILVPLRLMWWASQFEKRFATQPILSLENFYHRRIIPREVADQYARRTLTDSRFVLGALHPTMTEDRRLVWQAPVLPNSLEGTLAFGIENILEVLADTVDPVVRLYPIRIPWGGEGNILNFFRLIELWYDPLSEPQPPVYDPRHRVALIPLIRWYWRIPVFYGVYQVDSLGKFTFLDPQQAAQYYPHLRLFPEALVQWQAETWGLWRAGIVSRYFSKAGVFEVADIGPNPAPLLLDNQDQSLWVVPMEPVGKSFGLAGLLFCDAVSGQYYFWNTMGQGLMSPSRALDVALGYEQVAILKNTMGVEPKLTIANGIVYWIVPVIPLNASQIQKLVLVEAATGKVRLFEDYKAMWHFFQAPIEVGQQSEDDKVWQQLQDTLDELRRMIHYVDSLVKQIHSQQIKRFSEGQTK